MLDLLLLVVLVAVVYRGYRRGLIREGVDLLLLVVALLVAFRTAPASEAFFASWTGTSPLIARFLGGFTVFFLIQFVGSIVMVRLLRNLGPVRPVDQVAGAVLGLGWFFVGATIFLLVMAAVPTGGTVKRLFDESRAADVVASEGSFAMQTVSALVGDRVLESLVNLNQILDDRQVVISESETVLLPVLEGELVRDDSSAEEIVDLLNLARVDAGEAPLSWSSTLSDVAAAHAFDMYEGGYFSHISSETGTVADRVTEAGIPYAIVGENLALSPTAQSVHDGLLASPGHRANMLHSDFTRVGVAAIDGPLGLMVVQVFSG